MASLVVDDGSAVAECWASGNEAAILLGLHGSGRHMSPVSPSIISLAQNFSLHGEQQLTPRTSWPQVLRCLVRKHKNIFFQGKTSQEDAETISWVAKGANGDLEESDALVLRLFLEQSCQLGPKVSEHRS